MAIKLIALDIDGTLTPYSESIVSKKNVAAIRRAQEQGVFVTIATGRACFATRSIWEQLSVEGPSIQYGGAWVVDTRTEELIDSVVMDPTVVRDVLRFADEIGVPSQLYQNDVIYTARENPYSRAYVSKNGMPLVIDPDICSKSFERVPKVLAFCAVEREAEMHKLFSEHFQGRAHVTRSQSTFIEINDFAATKGQALSRLAAHMGLKREEVAAIGDSYLDMDMIEWAGDGVCVENSVDDVKKVSDIIVPACEDDGVAYYIEQYVLQQEG